VTPDQAVSYLERALGAMNGATVAAYIVRDDALHWFVQATNLDQGLACYSDDSASGATLADATRAAVAGVVGQLGGGAYPDLSDLHAEGVLLLLAVP
jgi:hypothetical protein